MRLLILVHIKLSRQSRIQRLSASSRNALTLINLINLSENNGMYFFKYAILWELFGDGRYYINEHKLISLLRLDATISN